MFYQISVIYGKDGSPSYVYISQMANRIPVNDQCDYALYCILTDVDVDGYAVPQNVKFEAAIEWRKRYPNVCENSPEWMTDANTQAIRLTA